LDFRWPSIPLVGQFRSARLQLDVALAVQGADAWPQILASHFRQWLRKRLHNVAKDDDDTVKWVLREMSALGAMLMHLQVISNGKKELRLINGRRNRTEYGTYPTSPWVAEALAGYVWGQLAPVVAQTSQPQQIFDPTMEGGPLLLEMAFQAPIGKRAKVERNVPAYDFILSGVDQNSASVPIVSSLLDAWRSHAALDRVGIDVRKRDAFEALGASGPLDAIVNNPPWGARTDGASGVKLFHLGPYIGYRDPYIALVSSTVGRLKPGRPFGFVLPFQLLTAASAGKLREELLENAQLDHLIQLPRKAFPRATVKTVMLLGCRRRDGERRRSMQVVQYPPTRFLIDPSSPTVTQYTPQGVQCLGAAPWLSIIQSEAPFVPAAEVVRLGDVADVVLGIEPYRLGRGQPRQTKRVLALRPYTFDRFRRGTTPVVRSRDIERFRVRSITEYVRMGAWLAATGRHLELIGKRRTLVRQICGRDGSLIAAAAPLESVARYGVFTVVGNEIAPDVLCALLHSDAVAHFVRSRCAGFHRESFGRITISDLRNLPVPTALLARRSGLAERALRMKLNRAAARAIAAATGEDTLALGRAMIEINRLINQAFGRAAQTSMIDSAKPGREPQLD
jgi:hypothetical protein